MIKVNDLNSIVQCIIMAKPKWFVILFLNFVDQVQIRHFKPLKPQWSSSKLKLLDLTRLTSGLAGAHQYSVHKFEYFEHPFLTFHRNTWYLCLHGKKEWKSKTVFIPIPVWSIINYTKFNFILVCRKKESRMFFRIIKCVKENSSYVCQQNICNILNFPFIWNRNNVNSILPEWHFLR